MKSFEELIHDKLVEQTRKSLEQTFCIRCGRCFFECDCTTEQINTYLIQHPMKVRYAIG